MLAALFAGTGDIPSAPRDRRSTRREPTKGIEMTTPLSIRISRLTAMADAPIHAECNDAR